MSSSSPSLCALLLLLLLMASAATSSYPRPHEPPLVELGRLVRQTRQALNAVQKSVEILNKDPDGETNMDVDAVVKNLESAVPPQRTDEYVSTQEILKTMMGYRSEVHHVFTEDGYRLRIDRLANKGSQPVLLAHGLLVASQAFVLLGNRSLCSLLHTAGYDVWMVNYRGSEYSLEHKNYTIKDEEFWRFSWHENGVFDNPAAIDYVIQKTGFPQIVYIGHSMGSTTFFTMASSRPEYQRKLRAAFLMGPVATLKHHQSLFVRATYPVVNGTQLLMDRYRIFKTVRPFYLLSRRMAFLACQRFRDACYRLIEAIAGPIREKNYFELPYYWNTYPSGSSFGQIFHYIQNANQGLDGFRHYNYGPAKNKKRYGTEVPPKYQLSEITMPLALYSSYGDVLCAAEDAKYLRAQLPNVFIDRYVDDHTFNHIDYIDGQDADQQVYLPLIKDLNEYLRSPSKAIRYRDIHSKSKH